MRRHPVLVAILLVAVVIAGLSLWPSSRPQAGYPFARRVTGGVLSPLWKLSPEALDRLTADDAGRLEQAATRLDRALEQVRAEQALLATRDVADFGSDDRRKIRELWYGFFEPMLALDDLKMRYQGWYGIDYLAHPALHARSFGIAYTALCAQVAGGQGLLDALDDKDLPPKMFDEAMPELGLPRGTFSATRARLGRARDYSFVPVGAQWYEQWIDRHLSEGPGARIRSLVRSRSDRALDALRQPRGAARTLENKTEVVKGAAFQAWFPLQKEVAEWAGDTRVAPEGRRLINDAQLAEMKKKLRPGDLLVERRNWYLSNVGLPGFWPHAALFSGSQDDIKAAFDADPAVLERFGGKLSEHLAKNRRSAWEALGSRDDAGHAHAVIEAVSEGVVAASFEHSCGADYVAALRPKLPLVEVATALDRALGYFGRPYDFDFDFVTDDRVVCSELVVKAFEPAEGSTTGLKLPWITVAGRRAVPPTEIVRAFAAERGKPEAQLEFVHFLEGRESSKDAIVADADALAKTPERAKWDIMQP